MMVMDTNRRMLADTKELESKYEVALMSAGTLACLVSQNGDYVGAIYSTEQSVKHFPFKTGLMNIENILEHYHKSVTMQNKSDMDKTLDYIIRNFRRKMILVIVTDMEGIREISETTFKRLLIQHDILLIRISDADMTGKKVYNMNEEKYLPEFFTSNKKLAKLQEKKWKERYKECIEKLKHFGIAMSTIDHRKDIDTKLMELLHKHKYEKR